MTKAVLCVTCSDVVSPYRDWQTDRRWRWCQCDHVATRWRDGARGLIEVTSLHGPDYLRVIGINNGFLQAAISVPPGGSYRAEQWRELHALACEQVEPHYLFHKDNRACWALIVRVGESGDVFLMDYAPAWGERHGRDPGPTDGAVSSTTSP